MEHLRIVGVYETVVYGPDVPALVSFYTGTLGLRLIGGIDEIGASFRLPDGGMLLVFDASRTSATGRAVPSHGTIGSGHVAFAIGAGEHDTWLARLEERGAEIERLLTWSEGGRSIYLRDPAGNSVELVDGEAWPP